jgi:hypothetical protein
VKPLLELVDMEPPCLRWILVRANTFAAKIHTAKLPAESFASLFGFRIPLCGRAGVPNACLNFVLKDRD